VQLYPLSMVQCMLLNRLRLFTSTSMLSLSLRLTQMSK
jgi:hypothetical protein